MPAPQASSPRTADTTDSAEPARENRPLSFRSLKDFASNLVDNLTGRTPFIAAKSMESKYFPDERRIGINRLVSREFGRHDPYVRRYSEIARFDSDWLVRSTAVRAVNRARHTGYRDVLITALKDENDRVRLESAKALKNMPDPQAVDSLILLVINPAEPQDVRIAAADALRHYRRLDVGRALIAALQSRDFGVAWQARESLLAITGKNLGYDESPWLDYITGPEKPFG